MKNIIKHHMSRMMVVICGFFALCFVLAACNSKTEEKEDCMQYVIPENVGNILGKEREEMVAAFSEAIDSEQQSSTEEMVLNRELTYKEKAIKVTLVFQNDRLFRVQYDFGMQNEEAAFEFTEEVYALFKENYGESDTYPGLPNRIDGLTFETYKNDDQWDYKEYWAEEEIFADIIPEAQKKDRKVDLGIVLSRRPKENEMWTIVDIGGIVNPVN